MTSRQFGRFSRIVCSFVAVLPLAVAACSESDSPRSDADARAAAAPAVRTPAEPRLSTARIVFLGDSLTAGLGLQREQAVPSLIQERLNSEGFRYEVVNAG